jgi:hypothetical protein
MKREWPTVLIECCGGFEDFDREIHCQHIHMFSGVASHRHKKCCDHSQCIRIREGLE